MSTWHICKCDEIATPTHHHYERLGGRQINLHAKYGD